MSVSIDDKVKARFPFIDFRKRDIRIKTDEVNALIPSPMFPLAKGRIRVFHSGNTGFYEDEALKSAFNSVTFNIGRCYSNTRKLLESHGGLKAYAGWLIGVDGMVIHHCWATFEQGENVHLLDGTISTSINRYINEGSKITSDLDELRRYVANQLHREESTDNTKKAVFGVCPVELLYIGTPTAPAEALNIWKGLCRKYPQHPAYKLEGQNQYGKSRMQRIYDGEDA